MISNLDTFNKLKISTPMAEIYVIQSMSLSAFREENVI